MVEEDAHLAVGAPLVPERVLDLRLVARRRAGEVVVAHRQRGVAVEVDLVVVEDDLLEALALTEIGMGNTIDSRIHLEDLLHRFAEIGRNHGLSIA